MGMRLRPKGRLGCVSRKSGLLYGNPPFASDNDFGISIVVLPILDFKHLRSLRLLLSY